MSSFTLDIWDDECDKVTFYTVKLEGSDYSETDRFLIQMEADPEMKEVLHQLLNLITEVIGNTYGAHDAFFNRYENKVTALPPKGKPKISDIELDYRGFPLRLYCLALSEEVVILFNGGLKDSQTIKDSKGPISMKFYEANEYAGKIIEALNTGLIKIEGRQILDYKGKTEIYL